jgi:hypothetical protein
MILDEAQVLAQPMHSDLAHSLRASLDGRKQNIKVVFAGSSETTLRRMFGRSTEPTGCRTMPSPSGCAASSRADDLVFAAGQCLIGDGPT